MGRNSIKSKKYISRESFKKSQSRFKIPKNLFKILKDEILEGNLSVTGTENNRQQGMIRHKKINYFVDYDPIKKNIVILLSEKAYNRYKGHI